jgi:disulfide bond formation protein DsbB
MICLNFLCRNLLSIFFLTSAAAALVLAVILEYGFGFTPCKLCIYERWPYFLIVLFSIAMLIKPDLQKIMIIFIFIALLIGILISVYHIGVEYGVFKMMQSCATQNSVEILDMESVYKQIMQAKAARCDVPQNLLGLPLSQLNLIYMVIIVVMGYFLQKKHGSKKDKAQHNQS